MIINKICPTCNKSFLRLDLHKCTQKEPDLEKEEDNIDIVIPEQISKNWSYFGLDYILGYLWNTEAGINVKFYKLKDCKPEVFIDDIEEGFKLIKPALISEGMPIFLARRGEIPSITIDFLTNKERQTIMKEHPMSSDEFFSWVKSGYTNQILKMSRFGSTKDIVLTIAFIIISCLITFVAVSSYYNNIITNMQLSTL